MTRTFADSFGAPSSRRLLAAGLALAAWLAWAAPADAAYTAQVVNGRLVLTGNAASDQLALRLQAGVPTVLQVDVGNNGSANFSFARSLFDRILVRAGAGNDTVVIDQVNGAFTTEEATTLNGESGNDALAGGSGSEILIGGPGRDTLDGNAGDDTLHLGDGNDTARWDPGDGNEVINGLDGVDTLDFNGSGASELVNLTADGQRLRFFRNVANVTVDAGSLERVVFESLGGADTVSIGNLRPTAVTQVTVDVDGVLGSGPGDAQPDVVSVLGSGAADVLNVSASGSTLTAAGLGYAVRLVRPEAANDSLVYTGPAADRVNVNGTAAGDSLTAAAFGAFVRVTSPGLPAPLDVAGGLTLALKGLGGSDSINASGNIAGLAIPLRYEGGPGNDQLGGSNGADRMLGGPGNDAIDGNQGDDNASGGDGADVLIWDPGDGNDVLRGDAGATDLLAFNGSAASEIYDLRADGPRLRLTRNVGNIVMNVDGVERVLLHALGGADLVTVRNLAATDVDRVTLDLEGALGGGAGDGQPDSVVVNGTSVRDLFTISASGTMAVVSGLAAVVRIDHPEPANDTLTVNGLGGVDRFTIGSGLPALIGVTVNQ
jgi:Ca2+-binding RTX toxin-like protein